MKRIVAGWLVAAALVAAPSRADPPPPAQGGAAPDGVPDAAPADVVDRIVALVGDEVVLLSEVDEELYLAGMRGEVDLADAAAVDARRGRILDNLVEAKILLEEARRQGVRVERTEVDRSLDAAIGDVRERFPTEQAFEEQLQREGISLDQLKTSQRAKIEEQLMVRQLVDRSVRSKVVVEPREVQAYYEEHRADIPRVPARLDLYRILVSLDAAGAVDSAAVRRAGMVKGRLDAGEDFATLARVFSEGPGSDRDGDIGWFRPEDLDPALAEALQGLAPGQTTGVIVSGRGAQVLRLEERDPLKGMHLRQIVFLRDEEAARASARARAESILARLKAGEDFAAVAKAESGDRQTAEVGGHIGMVPIESLESEYRTALEATETGGLSGIVEDAEGFSIFRVAAREGERDATFEDVRERIEELVRARKGQALYVELLAAAREKTYVETRLAGAGS